MDFDEDISIINLSWCPHCRMKSGHNDTRISGMIIGLSTWTICFIHKPCKKQFLMQIKVDSFSTEKEGVRIDMLHREEGDYLR